MNKTEYVVLPKWISDKKQSLLRKIVRIIYEPLQLFYYTIKLKPDLINGVFTLPKGLNSTIVGMLTRTSSIVSVIGNAIEIRTYSNHYWFWERVNLWMLRKCSAVTTTGSKVTDYIISKGVPAEKIFTFPGAIDLERFHYDNAVQKTVDIIFVGNFSPLKGPDRVLTVIKKLIDDNIDINAVMLGAGQMFDYINKLVREWDLQKNVTITGYFSNPEYYLKKAKCILIPSKSEGLPMCMLEAMACGCVPVVSDVGNVTDAAFNEENALVIDDWNDIESFTNATKRLLQDNELWSRLSLNGRKLVEERYSPDKQSEIVDCIVDYLGIYPTNE